MPRSTTTHTNSLASARVLIIGGTSGVGYASASAALANGSSVYVSSSSPAKVETAIDDLRALYPTSTVAGSAADLSQPSTVELALRDLLDSAVTALNGPLDHIVFTAGDALILRQIADLTAANAFETWTVRYLAPLLLAKLIATKPGAYLVDAANSSLTLTSGTMTSKPRAGTSAAAGMVGALETVTKTLALDLAPIRVNVVLLGLIHTELVERIGEEVLKSFGVDPSGKGMGKPEEAAEAYLFCMRSAFTTGQDITVDGCGV